MWFSIVVCDTFNVFAISRTVIWGFDSIMASILSSSTSEGRPERWSSLSKKSPERNFFKPILTRAFC